MNPLLVQYYGKGRAMTASSPFGAMTPRARYGIANPAPEPRGPELDIARVRFRMLKISEIQAGMSFPDDYDLLDFSGEDKARLLGNAVTPKSAEFLVAPLVEAITGQTRLSGGPVHGPRTGGLAPEGGLLRRGRSSPPSGGRPVHAGSGNPGPRHRTMEVSEQGGA